MTESSQSMRDTYRTYSDGVMANRPHAPLHTTTSSTVQYGRCGTYQDGESVPFRNVPVHWLNLYHLTVGLSDWATMLEKKLPHSKARCII